MCMLHAVDMDVRKSEQEQHFPVRPALQCVHAFRHRYGKEVGDPPMWNYLRARTDNAEDPGVGVQGFQSQKLLQIMCESIPRPPSSRKRRRKRVRSNRQAARQTHKTRKDGGFDKLIGCGRKTKRLEYRDQKKVDVWRGYTHRLYTAVPLSGRHQSQKCSSPSYFHGVCLRQCVSCCVEAMFGIPGSHACPRGAIYARRSRPTP